MKKFYKVALALAIALGSVSAYAVGSAEPTTPPIGVNGKNSAIEVYSVGNVVFVSNAEGQKVTITAVLGNASETAVVNGGQVEVSKITGPAVVTVGGVAQTVYIK